MSRRLLVAGAALTLAAVAAGAPAVPPQPAAAQSSGPMMVVLASGDISPPTNESTGNDYATSELVLGAAVSLVLTLGDNQYEYGEGAMFASQLGYAGSWGRFKFKTRPAEGNHDAADAGAGSPGMVAYFADRLTGLECQQLTPACHPEQGYYDFDLDVNQDGTKDWYVLVLNSNCQRAGGGTGDVQTPSCAAGSPMLTWLDFAQRRRHGGSTSGQKCSIAVWHHERWGTLFFADDPSMGPAWENLNRYHADLVLSGHTHSFARLGAMTPQGHLAPGGAGIRQLTAGAGGRSLSPIRVTTPREGTRYRDNTHYGVLRLFLGSQVSTAGWTGGTWDSTFLFAGGGEADRTGAVGCWP